MLKDMITILWERSNFFGGLLLEHLEISLIVIAIAVIIGGITGILISEYDRAARPTLGVINFLYTIPSISMLGFLIPFSGVGNVTAVIALIIYALLPMVRATHTGIKNVDAAILEAAEGMGSTKFQILYKIKLPLAMPVIMSGIRNMVTMTIALAGIASFIGAGGLGVAIYRGITTNNAAMTMAGSLLIALLALALDFILGWVEKRMARRTSHKKHFKKGLWITLAVVVCAGIGVLGFVQSQTKDTIRIATKPMTEQYILGEMLKMLIEQDTNLNVELTTGVGGGTANIQPAMEKGDFDLYPEYTGTGWSLVLKEGGTYTEDHFEDLQQQYKDQYKMEWVGMYGFNNTYSLAVRKEIADQYHLKTFSDLQPVADKLMFGGNYDFFEREDGYQSLCKTYNLKFKGTMDLDIGLKYQAINEGKIDVMSIYTTDGQLSTANVTVLEDDKHLYPSYMCGNVVRQEVINKHPQLLNVLKKLTGKISDQQMAQMNNQVETEGKEPRDVAENFLKSAGLLR
ncbi:MAG: glycine betaine ABC transporter substrate-binding protein [Eubacteriaceae bacterium]|nr:glycine betaine ABC transporter substrate-binding protein [Eubacteriaceae bacterium]